MCQLKSTKPANRITASRVINTTRRLSSLRLEKDFWFSQIPAPELHTHTIFFEQCHLTTCRSSGAKICENQKYFSRRRLWLPDCKQSDWYIYPYDKKRFFNVNLANVWHTVLIFMHCATSFGERLNEHFPIRGLDWRGSRNSSQKSFQENQAMWFHSGFRKWNQRLIPRSLLSHLFFL